MRLSLVRSIPSSRAAVAAALLLTLAATSGCAWLGKSNALYAQSAQTRPLEVPPDLDRPRTAAAPSPLAPAMASAPTTVPAPAVVTEATPVGFTAAGNREDVYAKVDTALGTIDGVQIASRAALIGVFDVNYEGSNFLLRINTVEAGARVSAIDPRGLPAVGDAPTKLIAALRAILGGN